MSRSDRNGADNAKSKSSGAEELYGKWNSAVSDFFGDMTVKERLLWLCGFVFTGMLTFFSAYMSIPELLGYSASGLNGLCHPIADAILCASGIYAPAAYIALILHAYLTAGKAALAFRAILLTGILGLRIGICEWLRGDKTLKSAVFRESPLLKLSGATVLSVVCAGSYIVRNGIDLDTLPSILTVLLATPVLSLLFSGAFSGYPVNGTKRGGYGARIYYEISMYSLFALSVWCASEGRYTIAGCSVAAMVSVFFTFTVAHRGGTLRGGILGAVLGYIYMPRFTASLAVGGMFMGMLSGVTATVATSISCIASCATAVIMQGYVGIVEWVPECVLALAVTSPVIRYSFLPENFPLPSRKAGVSVNSAGDVLSSERELLSAQKLYGISEAFKGLSDTCKERIDDAATANAIDIDSVCERLCHGFCDSCPMVAICWDNGRKLTKDAVKTITKGFYKLGDNAEARAISVFPSTFNCLRKEALKNEILRICETSVIPAQYSSERPESFSEEYAYISDMLRNIADNGEEELTSDDEATVRVRRAARTMDIPPEAISVIGKRNKKVIAYGVSQENLRIDSDGLRETLSKACGIKLGVPVFSPEHGGKMTLKRLRRFSASSACATKCNPYEERNGDSCAAFVTDNGYFYSVISDGMGSGSEASESAELATSLAQKLLSCEISKELAVKMIGSALRRKGNECFATVDMMELDLITGSASFLKSGAACSYILRDGEVYCVSARSMPVGIIAEVTPEQVRFSMRGGDIIVMISDGIAQDADDGGWLIELIETYRELSPKELADAILDKAIRISTQITPTSHDDMSVTVIKISSEAESSSSFLKKA